MICHEHKLIFIHINKCAGCSIEKAFGQPLKDHRLPHEIIANIGYDKWQEYFKFSIVRNPWDRLVSQYNYRKNYGKATKPFQQWFWEDISIETWQFMPQYNWITGLDYIARFENLQEDFKYVCEKIGKIVILPHINKTSHNHYSWYYDDEMVKRVEELYSIDISTYGYTFEKVYLV